MITDDDLDRRLADAGATWRMQHTEPADVHAPTTNRTRTWLAAGLAAAVVAALAVTIAVVSTGARRDSSSPTADVPVALRDSEWSLAEINGNPTSASGTLRFRGDALTYYDGCDGYTRRVVIDAQTIRVTDQNLGQGIVCGGMPDPVATLSSRVVDGAVEWSLSGDRLTLSKPGVGTLVYARMASPLDGRWALLRDDDAEIKVEPGPPLTVAGDRLRYSDGVTTCTSIARIGAGRLHISGRPRCSGPGGDLRRSAPIVRAVFNGTVSWSVTGAELQLSNTSNHHWLTYLRMQFAPTPRPRSTLARTWLIPDQSVGRPMLTFKSDGTFRLMATCTSVSGLYSTRGSAVSFSQRSALDFQCMRLDAHQTTTLSALNTVSTGTATWRVEHGRLTLRRGGTTLTFSG